MSTIELPLQTNGHVISRETTAVVDLDDRDTPGWVPMPRVLAPHLFDCAMCGALPEVEVTDAAVLIKGPCPYPDGIQTTEITIDVPSGKLAVADSLRPVYDWDHGKFVSYNSALGQAQAVQAMAEIGCAFGWVGNSDPGLYRTGPDRYVIASPELDDNDEPSLPGATCLAEICTDLWAFSIADFEDWKTRGGDLSLLGWKVNVVDVAPGTYRFTLHTGRRGFDPNAAETVIFADIERIA
ncbi:hypothetical protein ACWEQL_00580 [Kitasatospora sp. NPDC004240]